MEKMIVASKCSACGKLAMVFIIIHNEEDTSQKMVICQDCVEICHNDKALPDDIYEQIQAKFNMQIADYKKTGIIL